MRDKVKILITNQKGGVGKSTISANLTGFLAIEKNHKVSLIDFDKQGTSSVLIGKNPHSNIQAYKAGLSYQQNSNYTMLEARAALRRYGAHAEITIADLTWTFGLPYDFMLDFDIVIVPFPFTDKLNVKNRPALILSNHKDFNQPIGQSILAMITSARNEPWPLDIPITDLSQAGLSKGPFPGELGNGGPQKPGAKANSSCSITNPTSPN